MKTITIEKVKRVLFNNDKPLTPYEISQQANLCLSSVYLALKELKAQGLIEEIAHGRTTKFKIAQNNNIQNLQNLQNLQGIQNNQSIQILNPQGNNNVDITAIQHNINDFIPSMPSDYINRKIYGVEDFEFLDRAFKNKQNVLLVGFHGCGKNYMVKSWCASRKLPMIRFSCDGSMTAEDIIGQWVYAGGQWVWNDGLITIGMKYGAVIVMDEINMTPPDILAVLHSALDDDRSIVLRSKDNEIIKAHPNTFFIATMNPQYAGTKELNKALEDRFDVIVFMDYDKNIEKKLIENEKLLQWAWNLRQRWQAGEINSIISTRALLSIYKNIQLYGKEFAIKSFLQKCDEDDRQAIEQAFYTIVGK